MCQFMKNHLPAVEQAFGSCVVNNVHLLAGNPQSADFAAREMRTFDNHDSAAPENLQVFNQGIESDARRQPEAFERIQCRFLQLLIQSGDPQFRANSHSISEHVPIMYGGGAGPQPVVAKLGDLRVIAATILRTGILIPHC